MNDLRCDEFVELITAFLDGALDQESERQFVEHPPNCPGCTEYLAEFRHTIRALAGLTPANRAPAREALLAAFRDAPC